MNKVSLRLVFTVFVASWTSLYGAVDAKVGEKQTAGVVCPPTVQVQGASSLKIYYADPYKIIPNLDQWKDERVKIQKELEARTNQIEALKASYTAKVSEVQSKGNLITSAAREAALEELKGLETSIQVKQQSFQEYAERVTQEAQMSIFREIETATKEYAQENKVDFVFAGGALYVDPKFEISDIITERMNAKYRSQKKTGAAPAAQLNQSQKI